VSERMAVMVIPAFFLLLHAGVVLKTSRVLLDG
jgi:hypothetical protein